jgi:cell division inhibitor SulA
MLQEQTNHYSKLNTLAQPTSAMTIDESVLSRLSGLSNTQQWILFTSECPRPDFEQFSSSKVSCNKIIHMKASQSMSELETVTKAIKSGNASAVVASTNIDQVNQGLLRSLASQHDCEVFFVEGRGHKYH